MCLDGFGPSVGRGIGRRFFDRILMLLDFSLSSYPRLSRQSGTYVCLFNCGKLSTIFDRIFGCYLENQASHPLLLIMQVSSFRDCEVGSEMGTPKANDRLILPSK